MKVFEGAAVATCLGWLAVQLVAIATAPITHFRQLAWAPLHEQAWFRLQASVGDRALSDEQLEARYHLRGVHSNPVTHESWQLNELTHVFQVIEATERELPAAQQAQVSVTARVNGTPVDGWRWPR